MGVRTPAFVGFHPDAQLLLLERVPGRGDFHNLEDLDRRDRLAGRFIEVLADLHRRRPEDFGLDATMAVPVTDEEHALGELRIAEPLFDAADLSPEPVITFGRRWMRRNVPEGVDHTCFIQGDTGPGNFVFHGDDVWLVDLEISHFGDPMEDLAAICVRDMVTPSGDLRRLFAQYQSLVDWRVDLDRIRYHRVSKCVRSLMAIVSLAELGHQRGELLTWWAYRALYVRSACQALAEAMGLDFARRAEPDDHRSFRRRRSSWTALHELLDADLADLSRSVRPADDPVIPARLASRRRAAAGRRFRAGLRPGRDKPSWSELLGCGGAPSAADGLATARRAPPRATTLACDDLDLLRFLAGASRPSVPASATGHGRHGRRTLLSNRLTTEPRGDTDELRI